GRTVIRPPLITSLASCSFGFFVPTSTRPLNTTSLSRGGAGAAAFSGTRSATLIGDGAGEEAAAAVTDEAVDGCADRDVRGVSLSDRARTGSARGFGRTGAGADTTTLSRSRSATVAGGGATREAAAGGATEEAAAGGGTTGVTATFVTEGAVDCGTATLSAIGDRASTTVLLDVSRARFRYTGSAMTAATTQAAATECAHVHRTRCGLVTPGDAANARSTTVSCCGA